MDHGASSRSPQWPHPSTFTPSPSSSVSAFLVTGNAFVPWPHNFLFAANVFLILLGSASAGLIGTVSCHRDDAVQCRNSTRCIHRSLMCDQQADCPEGDDEDFVECELKAKITGFLSDKGASIVKTVNETHFNATVDLHKKRIHECSLSIIPAECMCHHRKNLYCDGEDLEALPDGLPGPNEQIGMLVLDRNRIRLPSPSNASRLRTYKVASLSLANNSIEDIPPNVFLQFPTLVTLDLSENQITALNRASFGGLQRLKRLYINRNRLTHFDLHALEETPSLVELELNSNELTLENQSFPVLKNLSHLVLSQNRMEVVRDSLLVNLNVTWLSLARNRIREVEPMAFDSCTHLRVLNLSSNNLETLHSETFSQLTRLESLDLGKNHIIVKDPLIFANLLRVEFLNVDKVVFPTISMDMFSHMRNLSIVHFKNFLYCSYIPKVKQCLPRSDGISSTDNLLGHSYIRHLVWWIGTVTILGNILVLFGRRILGPEHKSVNIFVRNLAVGDLITGIYLYLIGIQDQLLKKRYNKFALVWRSSPLCGFAGMLSILSAEASVVTLALMSIERCTAIMYPFKNLNLSAKKAWLLQFFTWSFAGALAVVPALLWPTVEYYGANGMCFPLHIRDPYSKGWQFSAFIFLGVNLVGSLIMIVCYALMFWSIYRTRKDTPWPMMVDESRLFKRFFFIVATDCACWIPTMILKCFSLAGYAIPDSVVTWFVVFVLPINAAINPILYTFSTSRFLGGARRAAIPHPSIKYQPEQRKSQIDEGDAVSVATSTTAASRGQRNSSSVSQARDLVGAACCFSNANTNNNNKIGEVLPLRLHSADQMS